MPEILGPVICPHSVSLRNLTAANNVCKAAPWALLWVPDRVNVLPKVRLEFPFKPDWKIDNGFFNKPIMGPTQILVHRWRSRTRISAQSRRRKSNRWRWLPSLWRICTCHSPFNPLNSRHRGVGWRRHWRGWCRSKIDLLWRRVTYMWYHTNVFLKQIFRVFANVRGVRWTKKIKMFRVTLQI